MMPCWYPAVPRGLHASYRRFTALKPGGARFYIAALVCVLGLLHCLMITENINYIQTQTFIHTSTTPESANGVYTSSRLCGTRSLSPGGYVNKNPLSCGSSGPGRVRFGTDTVSRFAYVETVSCAGTGMAVYSRVKNTVPCAHSGCLSLR